MLLMMVMGSSMAWMWCCICVRWAVVVLVRCCRCVCMSIMRLMCSLLWRLRRRRCWRRSSTRCWGSLTTTSRGVIVLSMAVGMFWRWVGRCSPCVPRCGGGVVSRG